MRKFENLQYGDETAIRASLEASKMVLRKM